MAENKIQPTDADVGAYIATIAHPRRREESELLLPLMKRATGFSPCMWGDSIVGYGQYHYHYASGRQGDFLMTGFAPRKAAMTVYIMPGFDRYGDLLAKLGKHRHSVSCLYITRFANVDLAVLEELVATSVEDMKTIYPQWKP